MTRRAWRYVLLVALLLALGGIGVSMSRRALVQQIPSFLATQALPELLQRIRNFHRVITREGRKVLELSASEASYFKNDKAVEVMQPKVTFFQEGEQIGEVTAEKGRLYLDSTEGTEVQTVEVTGSVVFTIGRLSIYSERMTYDRETGMVTAPGDARVEAAEMTLTGTGMSVDMLKNIAVVPANVKMSLRPKEDAAP
ncbi:MAG TPA: LPS export ABC transporter periplasmic protein LptC [Candidatus Binatia bacterium]|jgi:LPS export ABC transporter protein LptC